MACTEGVQARTPPAPYIIRHYSLRWVPSYPRWSDITKPVTQVGKK